MEVVGYEPNWAFGADIREGGMETDGRTTFEEVSEGRTRLTIRTEMPIDESMKDRISGLMQRSIRNIKELIEAETQLQRAVNTPIHASVPWPGKGHPEAMKMSCRRDYFHCENMGGE
jgi:hypothetical protein